MTLFSPALTWAVLDDTPRNPLRPTCSHQTSFAANKLYATKVHHPNPFTPNKHCFTPSFELYIKIFRSKQPLHHKGFTPKITPKTHSHQKFYTKNLLHQAPFTPNTFDTQILLYTPKYFYTKHVFTKESLYTLNLLHQKL